jgi:DtxR family Mn-dependent transcriptional regulator
LTDFPLHTSARIVHIEDEPDILYAQIIAEDLHPGMVVEIAEAAPHRIRFWSYQQEYVLAPIVAAQISVVPLVENNHREDIQGVPLSTLKVGETGVVRTISSLIRGIERRRLFDLGIIPGTEIRVEMIGPGRDPTAYQIRGSVIALRSSQAKLIRVDLVRETESEVIE